MLLISFNEKKHIKVSHTPYKKTEVKNQENKISNRLDAWEVVISLTRISPVGSKKGKVATLVLKTKSIATSQLKINPSSLGLSLLFLPNSSKIKTWPGA